VLSYLQENEIISNAICSPHWGKKKNNANLLAWNHPKSRQRIIRCRKYKSLMQFYRQLEGAKFASPDNRLQTSPWKTTRKKKRKGKKKRCGGLDCSSSRGAPQTQGSGAVAAGKKGPLMPQSAALRNAAIFSHVFQPLLQFLPPEQPRGKRAGLQIQTKRKRYRPVQNSEGDIRSATQPGIKPWWKPLPG